MLIRLLAAALILIVVCMTIFVVSSPLPCHAEIKAGKRHEQSRPTYKDCSSMVSAVFTPIGDFIHTYKDEITALSTLVIAIFTTILGCFTISVARSTRIAAGAADLSARAAVAIELPIIRIEPVGFGFGNSQEGDKPRIHFVAVNDLIFSNLGRTKAFPIEVQCGWFVGDKLPDRPTYLTRIAPRNCVSMIARPKLCLTCMIECELIPSLSGSSVL
jgi:hypothetical protein